MKKQVLTKEKIKNEVRYQALREIVMGMVIPILILVLIFILKLLDSDLVTSGAISSDKFGLTAIIILLSILFLIFVFVIVKNLNQIFSVQNNKFQIVKDRLINSKSGVGPVPSTTITFYRPYKLYFSANKRKYNIPSGKNYKWSKEFCMQDYNVFNSSTIGDEFYLVIINNKTIASVYNTKFFDFDKFNV